MLAVVRQDPSKQSDGGTPSLQAAVSVTNMARARADTGPLPSLSCALGHDTKQAEGCVLVVRKQTLLHCHARQCGSVGCKILPAMQRAARQAAEAECQQFPWNRLCRLCSAPCRRFVRYGRGMGAYRSAGHGS